MRWRSVSVIIGVCFILGLLIAPAIRPAQAWRPDDARRWWATESRAFLGPDSPLGRTG